MLETHPAFDWEILELDEAANFVGNTDLKIDTFIEILKAGP